MQSDPNADIITHAKICQAIVDRFAGDRYRGVIPVRLPLDAHRDIDFIAFLRYN